MATYHAMITLLLVELIENSIILSELTQAPETWQIGLAALSPVLAMSGKLRGERWEGRGDAKLTGIGSFHGNLKQ